MRRDGRRDGQLQPGGYLEIIQHRCGNGCLNRRDTAEVTGLTVINTTSVTITATSSQDATKSGAASVTVLRTITIGFAQPSQFPGNEVYSKYGFILGWTMTCSGCQVGDALYALGTVGQENIVTTLTQPTTTISLLTNFDANFNVPDPVNSGS